jgi:hypothetical protein
LADNEAERLTADDVTELADEVITWGAKALPALTHDAPSVLPVKDGVALARYVSDIAEPAVPTEGKAVANVLAGTSYILEFVLSKKKTSPLES